jgi:hypothetical protein
MMTYGIKDLVLLGKIAHCVDYGEEFGVMVTPRRIAHELKNDALMKDPKFFFMIADCYEAMDKILYRDEIAEFRLTAGNLRKQASEAAK